MEDRHVRIGEQNIDKNYFDEITLKGRFKLPALKISTEKAMTVHLMNALKNSIKLKEGTHHLYIEIGDKIRFIGKLDLNIDTVYKIENIFKRKGLTLGLLEEGDEDYRNIKYTDLIHTIRI